MSNDLGIDRSGNGNNWSVNNIAFADQVVDSPTNNFATLNPLYWNPTRSNTGNYSEGNLKESNVGDCMVESTIAATTGKWYFEARTLGDNMFGWGAANKWGGDGPGYQDSLAVHSNGKFIANGSYTGVNVDTSLPFNSGTHTIMMAVDLDNQQMWFGRNGTWYANPDSAAGVSFSSYATLGDPMVVAARASNGASEYAHFNFGQDSSFAGALTAQGNQDGNDIGDFYYTPPTGFLALCTKNLPDVAVTPSEHFNTVLYTGTGSSNARTGIGFQPDMVWIKRRDAAGSHGLFDVLRGTEMIIPDWDGLNDGDTNLLTSFDSDGFTLGVNDSGEHVNINTETYVAWNWKANGSGSSNTDGDITSTVSVNTDAGFSIVSYTGTGSAATIGHGLSKKPEMIIVKRRDAAAGWRVFHDANAANYHLVLDTAAARASSSSIFNNTEPTTSLFTVGSGGSTNASSGTFIAYCLHSVDGYSKVGSYTGNGNVDGTFVYTGFRPAYVIIKNATSSGTHWLIWDKNRSGYNDDNTPLYADLSNGEGTGGSVDLTSNGFKLRTTSSLRNENGSTIIYIAFAETPFKYSNAR